MVSELDHAKHAVVHQHRGGAVALAPLIGKSEKTLDNKVNWNVDTHHLTVDEAVALQAITGNAAILKAEAAQLGYACVPFPATEATDDVDLIMLWAQWQVEVAETTEALSDALQQDKPNQRHVEAIRRELSEDLAQGLLLLQRVETLQEQLN